MNDHLMIADYTYLW